MTEELLESYASHPSNAPPKQQRVLISVDEARERILSEPLSPRPQEWVGLDQGLGRVLATHLTALRTQPPADVSAMDGFAVNSAYMMGRVGGDTLDTPHNIELRLVGRSLAGTPFENQGNHVFSCDSPSCVQIMTGAVLPPGTDAVLIQELATIESDHVFTKAEVRPGLHVRTRGSDFHEGSQRLKNGIRISSRDLALAASMGHAWLPVHQRPRVALLMTGDEIQLPGQKLVPGHIVGASGIALKAALERLGVTTSLTIVPDREHDLRQAIGDAQADLLVITGGLSVGERDLVPACLRTCGAEVHTHGLAMRPGMPLLFGRFSRSDQIKSAEPAAATTQSPSPCLVLGLPGNPVSSLICALLFLKPLVDRLAGATPALLPVRPAALAKEVGPNGLRMHWLRASIVGWDPQQNLPRVQAFPSQDSSLISPLAAADGLIRRLPNSPAQQTGEHTEFLAFQEIWPDY